MKRFVKNIPAKLKDSLKSHLKKRQEFRKQQSHPQTQPDKTGSSAQAFKQQVSKQQAFQQQVDNASLALSRSGRSVSQLYRKVSGQTLNMAVKAQTVGELPNLPKINDSLTFYVLKEYSRSNSILVDLKTREHDLPAALVGVQDILHGIDENAGIIFLHHPDAGERKVSPRLARLVDACRQHPKLQINLVPVTILWGRAPDKEDSLFKLLISDNWEEPTIAKQLFNIGVMGRDTFVQFHEPQSLSEMIHQLAYTNANPIIPKATHGETLDVSSELPDSPKSTVDTELDTLLDQAKSTLQRSESTALITADEANFSLSLLIGHQLDAYLDTQRSGMLGPDLSDKRNLVDKLVYSPAIKHACQAEATKKNISTKDARKLARGYAEEMVNDYSYSVIRFFDNFLTWLWTQLYDGVEVHHIERVRALASDHELVYVPCHRSHMDYLLLAYVIYKKGMSLPYVAAGNNLDVPVIGPLLRNAVAFYIRRSFKDNELYKAVLKEYLHVLISRNTPIEYFIEGGRSRSGRLLPPKLGMLAMTVHSQLRQTNKPVVFIPTYIGYERIMEGGTYISELRGKPKESESLMGLLKAGRHIERIFGVAHVSFGTPLHLTDFMERFEVAPNSLPADRTDSDFDANTTAMIDNLSIKIMQNINKAAVVNPISLLALVLLSAKNNALDESRCSALLTLCQNLAHSLPYHDDTHVTTMSASAIINYGIRLKIVERVPHVLGDMIHVATKQAATLSYFRNNILHVFILPSLLAGLVSRNGRILRTRLSDIVLDLYPFLQSELFLYRAARNLPDIINQMLDGLIAEGLMVDLGNGWLGVPETNSIAYGQLVMLATLVEQSLERYFMTLALLAEQGSNRLTTDQVIDLCHLLGQRLSTLYADDMPDFFDKALFESFVATLKRLDYLTTADNGVLVFDQRIGDIASHARFILTPEVMQVLHHVASLEGAEIEHAIDELTKNRLKRFMKRG